MAIPLRYDAQLIAMVSSDLKDKLKAEAVEREVSISQVAREYIEAGIAINRITDRANETTANLRRISGLPAPTDEQLRDADGPYFPTTEDEAATEAVGKALDNAQLHGVTYPDPETARDAVEQQERNHLDAIDREPSLAEIAASLGPDLDGEDVEEVLGHDEHGDRLARLQARGLL